MNSILKNEMFCRTCLFKSNELHLLSNDNLWLILKECISVQVIEDPSTPAMICSTCRATLENFYTFRQKFLQVEELIKASLVSSKQICEAVIDMKPEVDNHFSSFEDIDTHSENNENPDQIVCPVENCSFEGELTKSLDHIRIEHSFMTPTLKCEYCDELFYVAEQVQFHSVNVHCKRVLKKAKKTTLDDNDEKLKKSIYDVECYQCGFCKEKLSDKAKLIAHASTHVKFKNFQCEFCWKSYEGLGSVTRHCNIFHADQERLAKCFICEESFFLLDQLMYHTAITHTRPKCPDCDLEFDDLLKFRTHLTTHPNYTNASKSRKAEKLTRIAVKNEKTYVCEFCDKVILCKYKYQHNQRNHRNEFLCQCPSCGLGFHNVHQFIQHLTVKHPDLQPTITCEKCNCLFFVDVQLKKHMRQIHPHTECQHCGRRFQNINNLKRHILSTHSNQEPKYSCTICGKKLFLKQSLKKHMARHDNTNQHQICNICGKKYLDVQNHIIYAHRLEPRDKYKCRYCLLHFDVWSELMRHSYHEHKQERETNLAYACEICDKKFHHKNALSSHIRVRHNEFRAFPCTECERTFKLKVQLKQHMRTHTDERPYACLYCLKRFRAKCTLTAHLRTHTGERPYVCQVCARAFSQSCSLKTHMKKHSNEAVESK